MLPFYYMHKSAYILLARLSACCCQPPPTSKSLILWSFFSLQFIYPTTSEQIHQIYPYNEAFGSLALQ